MDELPDELLISVVSRLSALERARTSVLARRWRCFWKYIQVLNFDDSEISNDPRYSQLENGVAKRKLVMDRFLECVNNAVKSHLGETINELDIKNSNDIDTWILFALAKKVQKLELNFEANTNDGHWNRFRFPTASYTAYAFPNVEHFDNSPGGLSLVSLSLNQVDLTTEAVHSLISNCPNLEDLIVKAAKGLKSFVTSCPATRLRRLTLDFCDGLNEIEICSPNLVSYELVSSCYGYTRTKLIGFPSLVHLSLAAYTCDELLFQLLGDVSGFLSRLETLKLHTVEMQLPCFEYLISPKVEYEFPSMPRLRKFVLEMDKDIEDNILCFAPLINAAPLLREIVLERIGYNASSRCSSRQIERPVMEMVLHALENTALLEKVVINKVAYTGEDLHLLRRDFLAKFISSITCPLI